VGAGRRLGGLFGRKPEKDSPRRDRGAPDPYPSSGQQQPSPAPSPSQVPGGEADSPTQIPAAGWKQVLLRTKDQVKEDNVPLLAAGVAFYAFIALFPALIAAVTLYGLVADPEQVQEQISGFSDTLPDEAASLLTDQLTSIAGGSSSALGWGLLLSVGGALFAASGGMQLALVLTLGAIAFIVVSIGLVAVLPVLLDGLGAVGRIAAQVARWAGLVVFVLVALAVIYRFGPDRDNPKVKWVGLGSAVATLLWIIGSAGFSLYVSNFGKYGETYGALAGVVILLLWLWLTSLIILVGAEINSETEQQTAKDTTQGPEKPMGERRAVKADSMPS
jgi:membrane protein